MSKKERTNLFIKANASGKTDSAGRGVDTLRGNFSVEFVREGSFREIGAGFIKSVAAIKKRGFTLIFISIRCDEIIPTHFFSKGKKLRNCKKRALGRTNLILVVNWNPIHRESGSLRSPCASVVPCRHHRTVNVALLLVTFPATFRGRKLTVRTQKELVFGETNQGLGTGNTVSKL